MYENALKCFAETFEAHTKGDNPEYAEKCKKHIIKRGLEIRAHLIKKAKIDLKAEKPDSWDPKSKKYVQKPFMVEDVPNKKQWEGIDGSKIEDKKDDIEDVEEDRKDKKEDEKDKKEEEKEDIEDEQEDIEDEQEDEEEDEDDDDD